MPFDPTAYLQKVSSTTAKPFDPHAYLASKKIDPDAEGDALATQGAADKFAEDNTQAHSAARGAVQGATFGLGDEAKGALQTGVDQLQGDPRSAIDNYRSNRQVERQTDDQAHTANPVSYNVGQVGGAIASSSALPGGLVAQGALQGLGDSKADLTQGDVSGAAKDAAIGGLAGKAFDVAPSVGNSVKNAVMESRMARAIPDALPTVAGVAGGIAGLAHGGPMGAYGGYKTAEKGAEVALQSVNAVKDSLAAGIDKLPPQLKAMSQSAAQKGGNALAVQHFILSQRDPTYAKAFDKTEGSEAENDQGQSPAMITGGY